MLATLGRLMARHRIPVVLVWAVLLVLGAVLGGAVFDQTSDVEDSPRGSDSRITADRLDELDPEGPVVTAVISGEDFYSPDLVESAGDVVREVAELPGVVEVTDAYTSGGLIGDDGRSSLVTVELDRELGEEAALELADEVTALLHEIDAPEVLVGGELLAQRAFVDGAIEDSAVGEGIAIVVVLALLIVVLGGFRAGVMPVLAALATIAVALLVLSGLIGLVPVNEFAVNIVTLLGLGLAVDYSLLVMVRFRDERARDPEAALEDLMARTLAGSGRAVLTSGLAVAIALAGMLLLGESLLSGMAIGGAVVVLVATLAGLTLVPALLALMHRHLPGARARTWARPWIRRSSADDRPGRLADGGGRPEPIGLPERIGLLGRMAGFAQRRAALVVVASTAAMLLLAAPAASLAVGSSDLHSLAPDSEERRAYEAITTGFADLGVEPVTVLVEGPVDEPGVTELLDRIAELPGVIEARGMGELPAEVTGAEFEPAGESTGAAALALVEQIRELDSPVDFTVGGPAAEVVDTRDDLLQRLPWAVLLIVVATFALLFALTRSVVVPVKALLLSTLTIASTLGVVVVVFQWGWGSGPLGIDPWGGVDVTTPLLICLLSFGLAMDYEVFLLARIQEEWRDRDPALSPREANDRAVLRGITATGPVVTTAAAAIIIVFLGFVISDMLSLKEVGIGMAVAVLLDVTIIRGLLLPALMTLLGRWNWWRPGRA